MATRKPATDLEDVGAVLRAELTERMRERCERYRDRVGPFVAPWPRILAQLEAGEPVEIPAYMVPLWARGAAGPSGRVLIDSDGTVHPVGF